MTASPFGSWKAQRHNGSARKASVSRRVRPSRSAGPAVLISMLGSALAIEEAASSIRIATASPASPEADNLEPDADRHLERQLGQAAAPAALALAGRARP